MLHTNHFPRLIPTCKYLRTLMIADMWSSAQFHKEIPRSSIQQQTSKCDSTRTYIWINVYMWFIGLRQKAFPKPDINWQISLHAHEQMIHALFISSSPNKKVQILNPETDLQTQQQAELLRAISGNGLVAGSNKQLFNLSLALLPCCFILPGSLPR